MGGAVSAGRDNDDLVDKLVESDYIKTELVERVFRAVDRADYFLPTCKRLAYKDSAWKFGDLHLSAPCIYSDVMEWLKLKAGLSFLNMGSGTGYLNTMAGLILGTNGINHGIELNSSAVEYAIEKLENFISKSSALDEFDFCCPKFYIGNCLCLPSNIQQYDRVYCGADCPKSYENNLKNLIKVGGILVVPIQGKLLQIKRKSDTEWVSKNIQHVSFASLVLPTSDHLKANVSLGDMIPPSLQELCRSHIRNLLRNMIYKEKPEINYKPMCKKPKSPGCGHRRFSLPIRDDESDSEDFDFSFLHNLDRDTGSREMNALLSLVLTMRRDVVSDVLHEDDNLDQGNQPSSDENHEDTNSQSLIADKSSDGDVSESTTNSENVDVHLPVSSQSLNESGASSSFNETGLNGSRFDHTNAKFERKRHHSEGEEDENDYALNETDSDAPLPLQSEKVKKMKRRSPPPVQPSEAELRRIEFSNCLKEKVMGLPLPMSLKMYVNMNRQF